MRGQANLHEFVRQCRRVSVRLVLNLPDHRRAARRRTFRQCVEIPFAERDMHTVQGAEQRAHFSVQRGARVVAHAQASRWLRSLHGGRQHAGQQPGPAMRPSHDCGPSVSGSAGSATHSIIDPS